ncbi:hypothetical protein KUTeg_015281 [Tegillarca granosa]|uniref:Uncharacterized protein n=1 Tax=Tegillarca granosa TaxID=220873 RepID=A0ABQ9EUD6_TEGGR|nr:hypothetical protein KUTeg_015281 [Tegillarca granosa]
MTDNVVKLNKHLQSTANSLCKKIENNPDLYSKLAQVLLTQVILFNRRRSGEAERMLLEGFNDAIKNGSGRPDPVVMSTLIEFEKYLCTSHTRVEIRGKRGRKVPVLLTDKMRQQIEEKKQMSNSNTYLQGQENSPNHTEKYLKVKLHRQGIHEVKMKRLLWSASFKRTSIWRRFLVN